MNQRSIVLVTVIGIILAITIAVVGFFYLNKQEMAKIAILNKNSAEIKQKNQMRIIQTVETVSPAAVDSSDISNAKIVNVKFPDDSSVTLQGNTFVSSAVDLSTVNKTLQQYKIIKIMPTFSLPTDKQQQLRSRGETNSGKKLPDLRTWFSIYISDKSIAAKIVLNLKKIPVVETVQLQGDVSP